MPPQKGDNVTVASVGRDVEQRLVGTPARTPLREAAGLCPLPGNVCARAACPLGKRPTETCTHALLRVALVIPPAQTRLTCHDSMHRISRPAAPQGQSVSTATGSRRDEEDTGHDSTPGYTNTGGVSASQEHGSPHIPA